MPNNEIELIVKKYMTDGVNIGERTNCRISMIRCTHGMNAAIDDESYESRKRELFTAALSEMRQVALREAAEIAINEKVDYEATKADDDEAYNAACDHISSAILGRIDK